MIWFAQGFAALLGLQVFFLLSHAAGAPWGVFAPAAQKGRASSAGAAVVLIATVAVFISGLRGAPWVAWAALAMAAVWFVIVAVAHDEGEQLLWRPVNGVAIIFGLAAVWFA